MGKGRRLRHSESRWKKFVRRFTKLCCCCFLSCTEVSVEEREAPYRYDRQSGLRTEGERVPIIDILAAKGKANEGSSDMQWTNVGEESTTCNENAINDIDGSGATSPVSKGTQKSPRSQSMSRDMRKRVTFDELEEEPHRKAGRFENASQQAVIRRGTFGFGPKVRYFPEDVNEIEFYLRLHARNLVAQCISGAMQKLSIKELVFRKVEVLPEEPEKAVVKKAQAEERDSIHSQAKSLVDNVILNAIRILSKREDTI